MERLTVSTVNRTRRTVSDSVSLTNSNVNTGNVLIPKDGAISSVIVQMERTKNFAVRF